MRLHWVQKLWIDGEKKEKERNRERKCIGRGDISFNMVTKHGWKTETGFQMWKVSDKLEKSVGSQFLGFLFWLIYV